MEVSIVFISLFIVVFGIYYLYYSTRHKERIALIEKDKDVSLFYSARPSRSLSHVWKIVILNLSLVSIGVGLGLLFGDFLHNAIGMHEEIAITASVFIMAGAGLLTGFFITRKMGKKD